MVLELLGRIACKLLQLRSIMDKRCFIKKPSYSLSLLDSNNSLLGYRTVGDRSLIDGEIKMQVLGTCRM